MITSIIYRDRFWAILAFLVGVSPLFAQDLQVEEVRYRAFRHFSSSVLTSTSFDVLGFDFKPMDSPQTTPSFGSQGNTNFLTTFLVITDAEFIDVGNVDSFNEVRELLKPYVYPSPFRLSSGAEIGYELPDDMDIEIRIYNMAGNEIYREFFAAGTMGGLGHHNHRDYNKVPLTTASFSGEELSAGVYFFILVHNGDVFAKGKFAVRP